MGDSMMVKEFPDEKQRAAICYGRWREKKEKKEMPFDDKQFETRGDKIAFEIRQGENEKPKIVGYAAVFNSWSKDLGGFKERIAPNAFTMALKESDTRALFNHDRNYVLGRQASGTLRMSQDDKGLRIEIDPPDTQWARDLQESIRRGDIAEQSFGFTVKTDEWSEEEGKATRTIKEFAKIYDVSIVTFPAYPETSVAVRSMQDWKKANEPQPPAAIPIEVRQRQVDLKNKLITNEKE